MEEGKWENGRGEVVWDIGNGGVKARCFFLVRGAETVTAELYLCLGADQGPGREVREESGEAGGKWPDEGEMRVGVGG